MKHFLLIIFTCAALHGSAQLFVGLKLMGISIHTDQNVNGHLYEAAIGKKNRLAFHFGLAVTCEYMFNNWFSVKADQAMFRDCAGKFAGMSMLNVRYTQDLKQLGNGSVGLGPFFYYRKSWLSIPGYTDEGYFKESTNKKWQTKFVWYGGEVEYNYPISPTADWSTNILPGIPVVIAVASGVRARVE